MIAPSEPESIEATTVPAADAGIYLDSSALVKLYVPEVESDRLDDFLRGTRRSFG